MGGHDGFDRQLNELVRSHSKFQDMDSLFAASPFQIETKEQFDNIPVRDLDAYIRSNTSFGSWNEMVHQAGEEWINTKLLKGVPTG